MCFSTLGGALAAATLLVGCGAASDADSTSPMPTPDPIVSSATVQATPANQFTPGTVNLAVGGTIEFEFGVIPHNVYFDDAPPDAPDNVAAPSFNHAHRSRVSSKGSVCLPLPPASGNERGHRRSMTLPHSRLAQLGRQMTGQVVE